MNTRNAKIEDLKQIEALNEEFFHEKGRNFQKLLTDPDKEMYVVEADNKIVGFSGVSKQSWNNTANGIDIFVRPDQRGKGVGSKLAQAMIEGARKMKVRCLIVEAPSKSAALPLYLKNGFRKCGYNDRYYNKGDEIAVFLSFDFTT